MRRIAIGLGLALSLLGCGAPRDEQVPLLIEPGVNRPFGNGGVLMHEVIDVVADPRTGMPIIANGSGPMRWPEGFTA